MADEKDSWKRRREREDEAEKEEEGLNLYKSAIRAELNAPPAAPLDDAEAGELARTTLLLMEQVHHLYQMYLSGAEKTPPIEKRAQVERSIQKLQSTRSNSATIRFKVSSATAQYQTYRDRWDRLMKDIESGKIKRVLPGSK